MCKTKISSTPCIKLSRKNVLFYIGMDIQLIDDTKPRSHKISSVAIYNRIVWNITEAFNFKAKYYYWNNPLWSLVSFFAPSCNTDVALGGHSFKFTWYLTMIGNGLTDLIQSANQHLYQNCCLTHSITASFACLLHEKLFI